MYSITSADNPLDSALLRIADGETETSRQEEDVNGMDSDKETLKHLIDERGIENRADLNDLLKELFQEEQTPVP